MCIYIYIEREREISAPSLVLLRLLDSRLPNTAALILRAPRPMLTIFIDIYIYIYTHTHTYIYRYI